jgi:5-(carboxyamino)imidazole ribonucleotide synthase
VAHGIALLAEEFVPFRRELAALVARSPSGQGAAYPVVQTVQVDGICREVIAPAPGLDPEVAGAAQALALRIASELDVTGLLAVELFETTAGGLLVNELAMRPHNSGHWTIEGSRRRSSSSTGSVPGAAMPPGDLQPTARPAQARVSSDDGVYSSMPGTTPRTTVK